MPHSMRSRHSCIIRLLIIARVASMALQARRLQLSSINIDLLADRLDTFGRWIGAIWPQVHVVI